jgi:hypothetical protein
MQFLIVLLIVACATFNNTAYAGPIQAFDDITFPLEEQLFSVPIESIEVTTTTTTTPMPAARCINFNAVSMPQWLENIINWCLGFAGASPPGSSNNSKRESRELHQRMARVLHHHKRTVRVLHHHKRMVICLLFNKVSNDFFSRIL